MWRLPLTQNEIHEYTITSVGIAYPSVASNRTWKYISRLAIFYPSFQFFWWFLDNAVVASTTPFYILQTGEKAAPSINIRSMQDNRHYYYVPGNCLKAEYLFMSGCFGVLSRSSTYTISPPAQQYMTFVFFPTRKQKKPTPSTPHRPATITGDHS